MGYGIPIPDFFPLGTIPREYSSGGPVGHNMDIYMYNAPLIEFYGPDIYLQKYDMITECFRHRNLPLLIPEQRLATGVMSMVHDECGLHIGQQAARHHGILFR